MAATEQTAETIYHVSSSPHIHKKTSIPVIMWTVAICLVPAGIVGIYAHGLKALWVILISVATAVITEYICQKIRGVKVTINDGSAVVTGLLFAYVISSEHFYYAFSGGQASSYWYVVVIGSFFSIADRKSVV